VSTQNFYDLPNRLLLIDHDFLLMQLEFQEGRTGTVEDQPGSQLCVFTFRPCFQQQTHLLRVHLEIIFWQDQTMGQARRSDWAPFENLRWMMKRDLRLQTSSPNVDVKASLDIRTYGSELRYQCERPHKGS
jgi:hypothetical protein